MSAPAPPDPAGPARPDCQASLSAESAHRAPPLAGVIGFGTGLRGGLVTRLQLNETVAYMAPVTYITVASETPGELLLSDRCATPAADRLAVRWKTSKRECRRNHAALKLFFVV